MYRPTALAEMPNVSMAIVCFVLIACESACGQPEKPFDTSIGDEAGVSVTKDGGATVPVALDSCTPKTCAGAKALCGTLDDGCGGVTECGQCGGANAQCSSTFRCVCSPSTCAGLGATCGEAPDGCGSVLTCGTCSAGLTCNAGTCSGASCTPGPCLAGSCGMESDGCGGILDCSSESNDGGTDGGCVLPETCGGGGVANLCGCLPGTCAQLGAACGTVPDGCGGLTNCGDNCLSPQKCGAKEPNQCG